MPKIEISGDGIKRMSIGSDGMPLIQSDEPIRISPEQAVTDVRVNLLEVTAITLSMEGSNKVIKGQFSDGGSYEVALDVQSGAFHTNGQSVISQLTDSTDKSNAILTYLPRTKTVTA